jgi:endonuclease/exonuclease/phosphatase (EEP) superfamily protein YafD
MARLALSSGTTIDFFNLHLDAGRGVADRAARRRQLDRVAQAVRRESGSRAVIVGGDFNLRYDDAEDRALLERFRSGLQLTDTGAGLSQPGRWPEKIDYLLYRSGNDREVELLEAGIAAEFETGEGALSDHPAIYARFRPQRVAKGEGDVAK